MEEQSKQVIVSKQIYTLGRWRQKENGRYRRREENG